MVSNFLAAGLKKFYTRKGNRFIFTNGMTLNQLAWEMWERLGYKEIDPSVLSRVLGGKRGFSLQQLRVFAKTLNLSVTDQADLEKGLFIELAQKEGLEEHLVNQIFEGGSPDSPTSKNFWARTEEEYFSNLLIADKSNCGYLEYWAEQNKRFWKGEFDGVLNEITKLEGFIKRKKLVKERRGKNWLCAISSLKANCLTHKLSPPILADDPDLARRGLDKTKALYINSNPLSFLVDYAWGSLMRLAAEAVYESGEKKDEVLELLMESLQLRKNAVLKLSRSEPMRAAILLEMMLTIADVETFFPKKVGTLLGKEDSSERIYEETLSLLVNSNVEVKFLEPLLYEFKARSNLKKISRIKSGKKREVLITEAKEEIDKAEKSLERMGDVSGTIGINTAVTKVNVYRELFGTPPRDILMQAIGLVMEKKDLEQGYRLLAEE